MRRTVISTFESTLRREKMEHKGVSGPKFHGTALARYNQPPSLITAQERKGLDSTM